MTERMIDLVEGPGDPADLPILLVMGATASALRWCVGFCDEH